LTYAEIRFAPSPAVPPPAQGTVSTLLIPINVTAPPGISIAFPRDPVKVMVTSSIQDDVIYTLFAAANVAPGNYNVSLVASYGSTTSTLSFTVTVVTYLVTISNDLYSPDTITVPAGSTVYWINSDLEIGNNEIHDVNFNPSPLRSPVLYPNPHYDTWSNTFATPGTYHYYDDYTLNLKGTVIVTS
jgi:plastocyanin